MVKNYNTAFAVLLGLKLRAVSQVAGLFESLEGPIQERFRAISELFSYQGSYKNYRGEERVEEGKGEGDFVGGFIYLYFVVIVVIAVYRCFEDNPCAWCPLSWSSFERYHICK